VTSLSGTLAPLPQAFVSVAALLPARCAARAQDGRYSSLVLGGREGRPVAPGGLLPSPLVREERLAADPAVIGAPQPPPSPRKFAFLTSTEKALPPAGVSPIMAGMAAASPAIDRPVRPPGRSGEGLAPARVPPVVAGMGAAAAGPRRCSPRG
jgi:hypothetical protein